MTEKDVFNTPEEEVIRLIAEVAETKGAIRELSGKLTRIETRLKRAFPSAFPKRTPRSAALSSDHTQEHPTLNTEKAMKLYEELVELAKSGDSGRVQSRLSELRLPDLAFLRGELGAPLKTKKSSRKANEEAILGRVRESVMLTKHTDRRGLIKESESERFS